MKKLTLVFLVFCGVLLGGLNANAQEVDVFLTNYVDGSKMTVYWYNKDVQLSCIISNGGNERKEMTFIHSETCRMKLDTFPITLTIEAEQNDQEGTTTITISDHGVYSKSNRKKNVQVGIGPIDTSRGSQRITRFNRFTITDTLSVLLEAQDFVWMSKETTTDLEVKNHEE